MEFGNGKFKQGTIPIQYNIMTKHNDNVCYFNRYMQVMLIFGTLSRLILSRWRLKSSIRQDL